MMSIRGLREVRSLIQEAHHIVVITGAGVSAESGIPTFRGPGGGLWREYDDPTRKSVMSSEAQKVLILQG